jgi:hypothetical protein
VRRSDAGSADREQGSLLAELMVAAGLMVLSVVIVGATLSGPVRGIAGLGHPQAGLEGVDELAVAFVSAVRAARPDLGRPAVLEAEPAHLLVALGHLRDGGQASPATWELRLEEDAALIDGRVVIAGVDATRTRITYRDAVGSSSARQKAALMPRHGRASRSSNCAWRSSIPWELRRSTSRTARRSVSSGRSHERRRSAGATDGW